MLYFKIVPSPESSSGCSHWSNSVVDVGAVRLMLRGGAVVLFMRLLWAVLSYKHLISYYYWQIIVYCTGKQNIINL